MIDIFAQQCINIYIVMQNNISFMKNKLLLFFTALTFFTILIVSCRKEYQNYFDRDETTQENNELAKIYHSKMATLNPVSYKKAFTNSRKLMSTTERNKADAPVFYKLVPQWKRSFQVTSKTGQTLTIVPTLENKITNNEFKVRRFFIFTRNGNEIVDGRIVEFIGINYSLEDKLLSIIPSYREHTISDFTGAIFQYDLNYFPITNSVYKSGAEMTYKAKLENLATVSKSGGTVSTMGYYDTGTYNGTGCATLWYCEGYSGSGGAGVHCNNVGTTGTCESFPGGGSGGSGGTGSDSGYDTASNYNGGGGGYGGNTPPVNLDVYVSEQPLDTIMEASFTKNVKAMCALSKLMSDNSYKSAINKFVGADKPLDLTFKIEPIASDPGTIVYGTTAPVPLSWNANNIELRLNENVMASASSLQIALTLIHEGIHAELYRKLLSVHGPSGLTITNFPSLFDLYNSDAEVSGFQHEYMAKWYVNLIAKSLATFDGGKSTMASYEALAWQGLAGTQVWKSKSLSERTGLTNQANALLSQQTSNNCQ